jgi:hypothetical protein
MMIHVLLLSLCIIPETTCHTIESFKARHIADIEMSDIICSLITECETFVSGQRCRHSISNAALTVIATSSCTILHFRCSVEWTRVYLEEHGAQLEMK